jgi:flagellar protein FliS
MTEHPALSYRQAAARGASPIGEVVALYDTILRDFVRALAALQAGHVEARIFEMNHALLVIGHLQSVLDHERGGEAAKQFATFYAVTRGLIVQANFQATPESIEQLIELYGGVRQAWYEADKLLPVQQQHSPAPVFPGNAAETQPAGPAYDDMETSRLQWSG